MNSISNCIQSLNNVREISDRHSAKYQGGATPYGIYTYDLVDKRGNGSILLKKARREMRWVGNRANDDISFIHVKHGKWQFFEHAGFGGEVLEVYPGKYDLRRSFGGRWNQRISSFRRVPNI